MKNSIWMIVAVAVFATISGPAFSAEKGKASVEKKFNLPHGVGMKEILKQLRSEQREVTVVLLNRSTYSGELDEIKDSNFILIEKIKGKEFYDVLIDISAISAIEFRRKG